MEPNISRENIFSANKGYDALEIDENNKLIKVHYYSDEKVSVFGKLIDASNAKLQTNKEQLNKKLFNSFSNKGYKYKSSINKASNIFDYSEILGYELKVNSDKKDINNSDLFNEIANVVAGRQVANLALGMLKKIKKVNITYLALVINTSNLGALPIVYVNEFQQVQLNSEEYNVIISKIQSIIGFIDMLADRNEDVKFSPNFANEFIEVDEINEMIKFKYKEVSSQGVQTRKHEIIKFKDFESYKVKVDSEEISESSGLLSVKGVTKAASKVNPFLGKMVKTVSVVSSFAPQEKDEKITKIRQVYLIVNTSILSKPLIKMQIFDSPIGINSDSRQYFEINNKLEEVTSIFERVLKFNNKNVLFDSTENETLKEDIGVHQSTPEPDKFDEIKKMKELLDMGIISQEEFNKKKVELLHL